MIESPVFEWVSEALEEQTHFNRLQARGTVRRALRQGGLDPDSVTPDAMALVLEQIMPAALAKRGVEDPEELCASLRGGMNGADLADEQPRQESPEEIFSRVFGD